MAKPFRTDLSLTREEWEAEFFRLLRSLLVDVYLFPADRASEYTKEDIDRYWEHTNWSPERCIEFHHSPLNPMNKVWRGQSARERRWRKWCEANHVVCTRSDQ